MAGILGARALQVLQRRVALLLSVAILALYFGVLLSSPELLWVSNIAVILAGGALGFLLGQLLGSGGREYAVIGVSDIALLTAAQVGLSRATGRNWVPAAWLLLGLVGAFEVGLLLGGAPGLPFLAAAAGAFAFFEGRKPAPLKTSEGG